MDGDVRGKNRERLELKKHLPPNLIRFVRVGDWVVFGLGQDGLPLSDELVRQVTAEKRPAPVEKNAWVTADLDWPRLARWFPSINVFDLPRTQLQLVGRDHNLHLDGKSDFPATAGVEPREMADADGRHSPADQQLHRRARHRAVAEKQGWAQPYEISPVPNQMFIWATGQLPLQTFAAVPVPDGQKALKEFAQKLSADTDWQSHFMTADSIHGDDQRPDFLEGCRSWRRTCGRCASRPATF